MKLSTCLSLPTPREGARSLLSLALVTALAACGGSASETSGLGAVGSPSEDGVSEQTLTAALDGVRVVDDPSASGPVANVRLYRNPNEVDISVANNTGGRVDIDFEDDGSATVRIRNPAGERTIETEPGSWQKLDVGFGGSMNDDVDISGDVPRDVELTVSTHAGDDRVNLSGDLLPGSEVFLSAGAGEDVILVSGDVLPGATLKLRTTRGNDLVTFREGDVDVSTGSGDDTIASSATRQADGSSIDAGPGDDRISGLVASITGGTGSDRFVAVDADSLVDLERGEAAATVAGPSDDPSAPDSDPVPPDNEPEPEPELESEPEPEPPATSMPADDVVSDLRSVWYVGFIDLLGATGPTGIEQVVLEFDDGAVTTDVDTVVADGRRASRRANPTEWGTSSVSNDTLRYRLDGTSDDVETLFTARARAARANERVDGCFGSRRGFSSGGVASIAVNTLCLDGRGRFSNDRAVATSTPAGSGSANSQVTGTYRLDGHAVRLDYDDGKTLETIFGIYEEGGRIETLLVGERVLNR